jgi:hypothetical protein
MPYHGITGRSNISLMSSKISVRIICCRVPYTGEGRWEFIRCTPTTVEPNGIKKYGRSLMESVSAPDSC